MSEFDDLLLGDFSFDAGALFGQAEQNSVVNHEQNDSASSPLAAEAPRSLSASPAAPVVVVVVAAAPPLAAENSAGDDAQLELSALRNAADADDFVHGGTGDFFCAPTEVADGSGARCCLFSGESLVATVQWLIEHERSCAPHTPAHAIERRVHALFEQWRRCATPIDALRCYLAHVRPANAAGAHRRVWQSPSMRASMALYDYQFFAVLLAMHRLRTPFCRARGLLLNLSPGLGKTLIALSLIDLLHCADDGPALVVCPASVIYSWCADIDKFFAERDMPYVVYHHDYLGNRYKTLTFMELMQNKIVIVTYDTLRCIYRQLSFFFAFYFFQSVVNLTLRQRLNVQLWRPSAVAGNADAANKKQRLPNRRGRPAKKRPSASSALQLFDPNSSFGVAQRQPAARVQRGGAHGHVLPRFLHGSRAVGPRLMFGAHQWPLVVFDESQFAANRNTMRHDACSALPRRAAVCLSGTPIRNDVLELQAQMQDLLGAEDRVYVRASDGTRPAWDVHSFDAFADRVGLHRMLLPVSYTEAGVRMPPLVQKMIPVDMSAQQAQIYQLFRDVARSRYSAWHRQDAEFARVLSDVMRMRQIAIAPWLMAVNSASGRRLCATAARRASSASTNVDDALDLVAARLGAREQAWCVDVHGDAGERAPKIARTVDLIGAIGAQTRDEKVIVYSMFAQALQLIAGALRQKNTPFVLVIGRHNPLERKAAFDAFRKRADVRVCLMTYPVGSVGLTLVEATHCVMLEPWYCYSTHLQALFRLWRIGQTKTVTVYWMLTRDTVERNFLMICAQKIATTNQILHQTQVENWPQEMLQWLDGAKDEHNDDEDDGDGTQNDTEQCEDLDDGLALAAAEALLATQETDASQNDVAKQPPNMLDDCGDNENGDSSIGTEISSISTADPVNAISVSSISSSSSSADVSISTRAPARPKVSLNLAAMGGTKRSLSAFGDDTFHRRRKPRDLSFGLDGAAIGAMLNATDN